VKKKVLSIIDIAKELNISQTAVSFILNGKSKEKRISNELAEKVLKFVAEVGYKPNLLARSLRTGKTNMIGLMVEDIANPFFANLARLIEDNAYRKGYKILYCSTDNDSPKARELIQLFRDRHVDGFIIVPTEGIEEDISALVSANSPVILFDRYFPDIFTDYIIIDNMSSTYNATRFLIQQGYREIAFVTIDSMQLQMTDRLLGYKKAIEERGLTQFIKKIGFRQDKETSTRHIMDLLQKKRNLDAVLFATNYLGISGLQAINRLGLNIPADIAVISFDDHVLFELYSPSVTAIAQPIGEISEKLINILLAKLADPNNKKLEKSRLVLQTSLIIRESTPKR
jgi:LacI family transcriptional regulator